MQQYSKEEQKEIGAFYSPKLLANLIARIMLSLPNTKCPSNKKSYVLDPATGDSILLKEFHSAANKDEYSYIGVDIESLPIKNSKNYFPPEIESYFYKTNALCPFGELSPMQGWCNLFEKCGVQGGVNYIISNPPWGANKQSYKEIEKYYSLAKGQYDVYDLFVELSLDLLADGGIYGFILPDSIYEQQHKALRTKLLTNTSLKYIYRLGEGFFEDVNIGVSIVVGIKAIQKENIVQCIHLSKDQRKNALQTNDLYGIVQKYTTCVPQEQMISFNYDFVIDLCDKDVKIFSKFRSASLLGAYAFGKRGVELSKKGMIYQCTSCLRWNPYPNNKNNECICGNCGAKNFMPECNSKCIIRDYPTDETVLFVRGEDISRYRANPQKYIELGFDGINYKPVETYTGSKILIRKTGVGITACLDYSNSYTNQVVYIYKRKLSTLPEITNEVLIGLLCSRVITYYIIKRYGNNGWRTHAYITQKMIDELPFPRIEMNSKNIARLRRIHELTCKIIADKDNIRPSLDAKVEVLVAKIYGLNRNEMNHILETISNAQKMIPFKALLNINKALLDKEWDIDI